MMAETRVCAPILRGHPIRFEALTSAFEEGRGAELFEAVMGTGKPEPNHVSVRRVFGKSGHKGCRLASPVESLTFMMCHGWQKP